MKVFQSGLFSLHGSFFPSCSLVGHSLNIDAHLRTELLSGLARLFWLDQPTLAGLLLMFFIWSHTSTQGLLLFLHTGIIPGESGGYIELGIKPRWVT